MIHEVELFASNDHTDLELQISIWLRAKKPKQILNVAFVADGAEYAYCALFIFEPSTKPLPRDRRQKG